jgi:hypothetical protein
MNSQEKNAGRFEKFQNDLEVLRAGWGSPRGLDRAILKKILDPYKTS